MDTQFAQPTGKIAVEVNKQSIARDFGVAQEEVCYFAPGIDLSKYKVIYSDAIDRAFSLPKLTPNTLASTMVGAILTHTAGSIELDTLAVERGEYFRRVEHFGNNFTLNYRNETIGLGAKRYRWAGLFPKNVTSAETLLQSGGISPTTWVEASAEQALGVPGASLQAWNDVIHLRDFTQGTPYTNLLRAVQAAMDAAQAHPSRTLDARGWVGNFVVEAGFHLTAEHITILGGQWNGNSNNNIDIWLHNTTLDGLESNNLRWMPKGGNNRVFNCEFNGHVRSSGTSTFVFQHLEYYRTDILPNGTDDERAAAAGDTDAGTFEMDGCVFRDGYFGILQQPSGGKVSKMVLRNLTFYEMMGDAIELNVVQKSFDNGCVIENIAIFGIDADKSGVNTPGFQSNWGIGIGLAGKSPYGYEIPDSQYVHNFCIRNVYAERVRQIVHVEVGRNFTVSNIHGGADNTVSRGSGLTTATVYVVGSKDFMIDGVYGEPVVPVGVDPGIIRTVMLQWGTNQIFQPDGSPFDPPRAEQSNSCFDYTVRNVHSKSASIWAGASAGKNTKCDATFENIHCNVFKFFGIASHLSLSNIMCKTFDAVGHPESGDGAFPDNFVRADETTLTMTNVNAVDENGRGGQLFRRCRYTHIYRSGGNVATEQYVNYLGSLGTLLGTAGNVFYPLEAAHGANGTRFPVGYEFNAGDVALVMERARIFRPKDGTTDPRNVNNLVEDTLYITTPFVVLEAGVFIPDTPEAGIKAAGVGTTQLVQNLTPNGVSSGSPWLFVFQFSPGCRITIPGAGPNGSDLNTWVVKPPYQTPPTNSGAPITMDIAHPIQTAVPAGTRIRATTPVVTRPVLTTNRSAYHGIAE